MKAKVRTTQDYLRQAVLDLQAAKIETASLDARLLMQEALGISREQLLFRLEQPMPEQVIERFYMLMQRRQRREPVSKILGRREFYGLEFKVTRDTLDPRPDSETLVEAVLAALPDHKKPYKILDLGVGTGCLSLALLKALPHANLKGVDCSDAALAVAAENALELGLASRAAFCRSNWFESVDGVFDVIVSNPPYIQSGDIESLAPEVSQYDPRLALDGGEDGLSAYRTLLAAAPSKLAAGGVLAVEIGAGQHLAVADIASKASLDQAQMVQDLAGIIRCLLWKK
ncbi:MAG: peptide chain release factor N(5)-glutamine methyltransferase [Rickettsiales bacterium]|nr:peptide chain release factor N(5)-glutamine methyltransferase [Rickettsiales bacterium]